MLIDGIAISGYRSFGNTPQKIGPFDKVNLLAGQNNSGKSNILLFLRKQFQVYLKATNEQGATSIPLDPLDQHQGDVITQQNFGLGLSLNGSNYAKIIARCQEKFEALPDNYGDNDRKIANAFIEQLLGSDALAQGTSIAWFIYVAPQQSNDFFQLSPEIVDGVYNDLRKQGTAEQKISHTYRMLYQRVVGNQQGPNYKEALRQILTFIAPHNIPVPTAHLIPAIRRIGDAGTDYEDYSGVGIIRRLHQLQSPAYNQQHLKANFEKINIFLQNVTGNTTARLEIPHDESMVMVHMDNRSLPLSSLGTGIHEVIILAAAATILEKQIVCVEEPELHLHPLLQRKLIRYLQNHTSNQYFLTTHSAHFLNEPGVQIFHVRHQDGKSSVDPVETSTQRAVVCADLGYRASDLVQANSVIWVEGPSDRIYLKHWLYAVAPELVEGLHYSIMFYGGRLLSHLTAKDPEIDEFISLRRLNRYISILIDSDKSKSHDRINETKRRVQREFNEGPGFAWVTQGREIENYIEPSLLEACVKAVHPSAVRLANVGQFDHSLHFKNKSGGRKDDVDKVKVAHEVAKKPAELNVLDLKRNIMRMANFIREANDL